MKKVYFYDGVYTGHHISYAKQIVTNTENSILVINRDRIKDYTELPKSKVLILDCKTPNTYRINTIGWLINFYYLIKNKDINKNLIYFLYADSIISYIFLYRVFSRSDFFLTLHWANAVVPIEHYRSLGHKLLRNFKFLMFTSICSKVKVIFVHGNSTKRAIENKYKTDKVIKINYGIEENLNRNIELELNKTIKNPKPNILFFGGIRKDKGIEKLAQLTQITPDYHYIIAGDPGTYSKTEIEELFKKSINVTLDLNFIQEDEIKKYFLKSDILILPYEYYFSGQSGPLTLSAIYRLPALGTDVGDMGETIKEAGIGETTESNEPMVLKKGLKEIIDKKSSYHNNQDVFYNLSLWKKVGHSIDMTLNQYLK